MKNAELELVNDNDKWQMTLTVGERYFVVQEFDDKPTEEEIRLVVSIVSNMLNSVPIYVQSQLIYPISECNIV